MLCWGSQSCASSSCGQLTAVSLRIEPSVTFGTPEIVFEQTYFWGLAARTYDVSPDGERFLMIKEGAAGDDTPPAELILVQNWLEE
ncbi:MAG: hypothetical protein V3V11_02255, partial [Vicinamibacteria bacterium]